MRYKSMSDCEKKLSYEQFIKRFKEQYYKKDLNKNEEFDEFVKNI